MISVTPTLVTHLTPNECFVFGSNLEGFSGAGAAGYAFRGTATNTWRTDPVFLKAMGAPIWSEDRVGKWVIYGIAHGYQKGREGCSYAIPTVVYPGHKRSIPLKQIEEYVSEFLDYASDHSDMRFYVTELGTNYAGWTAADIAPMFARVVDIPNVSLPQSFVDILNQKP